MFALCVGWKSGANICISKDLYGVEEAKQKLFACPIIASDKVVQSLVRLLHNFPSFQFAIFNSYDVPST